MADRQRVLFGGQELVPAFEHWGPGKWLDSGAAFSPCRTWRYALWRAWRDSSDARWPVKVVVFVGLNPSTADERVEDPTIRRCLRFARDWGGSSLVMLNAYGFRATDPQDMKSAFEPIGERNDATIAAYCAVASVVVVAWGTHCDAERAARVAEIVRQAGAVPQCLGVNKDGSPKHPLYVAADKQLVEWRSP